MIGEYSIDNGTATPPWRVTRDTNNTHATINETHSATARYQERVVRNLKSENQAMAGPISDMGDDLTMSPTSGVSDCCKKRLSSVVLRFQEAFFFSSTDTNGLLCQVRFTLYRVCRSARLSLAPCGGGRCRPWGPRPTGVCHPRREPSYKTVHDHFVMELLSL